MKGTTHKSYYGTNCAFIKPRTPEDVPADGIATTMEKSCSPRHWTQTRTRSGESCYHRRAVQIWHQVIHHRTKDYVGEANKHGLKLSSCSPATLNAKEETRNAYWCQTDGPDRPNRPPTPIQTRTWLITIAKRRTGRKRTDPKAPSNEKLLPWRTGLSQISPYKNRLSRMSESKRPSLGGQNGYSYKSRRCFSAYFIQFH